jgi:hypothetical protein
MKQPFKEYPNDTKENFDIHFFNIPVEKDYYLHFTETNFSKFYQILQVIKFFSHST